MSTISQAVDAFANDLRELLRNAQLRKLCSFDIVSGIDSYANGKKKRDVLKLTDNRGDSDDYIWTKLNSSLPITPEHILFPISPMLYGFQDMFFLYSFRTA